MLSTIDLVNFFRESFPDLNIFPIELPLNAPDDAIQVDIQTGGGMVDNTFNANVQIKVRDVHPSIAEEKSLRIRKFLEGRTDIQIKNSQIVLIKSVNPLPLYIGRDATDLFLFSNNYRFIVNERNV